MRKDIEIHIATGDVTFNSQNKIRLRTFRWVNATTELSRYIYGEVDVPYSLSEKTILAQGIYFTIPYTPCYSEFKIRIRRILDDGSFEYVANPVDGSFWFVVQSGVYGGEMKNVYASTLPMISESSFFVDFKDGVVQLYAGTQSDFNIIKANRQNANCLLACFPGTLYRYPLTGVGLARWINSTNVQGTNLTKIIQDEFEADGATIRNASFNYDTKQLELEVDVKEDF